VNVKKPLLKKPFGGSKYLWNNCNMGTSSAYCEVCGTNSRVDSESTSLTIDNFLGYQMVEECCGGLLDLLYEEFGKEFATRFFKEFSEDPFDPRFAVFLMVMQTGFAHIEKTASELSEQAKKNQNTLNLLKKH